MRISTAAVSIILSAIAPQGSSFSPGFGGGGAGSKMATMKTSFVSTSSISSTKTSEEISATSADSGEDKVVSDMSIEERTENLIAPISYSEMCKEAASAMSDAFNSKEGKINRQIVRVFLPRDPNNSNLGLKYENDAITYTSNARAMNDVALVPPDETWQGGIMQLYRACAPTSAEILREFAPDPAGIPPKLMEDRSIDGSGVDGIGLWVTENVNPKDDVSCFVQPTQETIDVIEQLSAQAKERLVLLINPQWRSVDDALDATSKTDGFFGKLASSLGGKGNSLKRLDAMNYNAVYTMEGYVCKNRDICLVKRFDTNWRVFVREEDGENYQAVGSSINRPTYQDCDQMLTDAGIYLSYL